jgi:hypothetical protein
VAGNRNEKTAITFRKLLHYDKFADARSVSEKMRKHVTITFQEKDIHGHHSGTAAAAERGGGRTDTNCTHTHYYCVTGSVRVLLNSIICTISASASQ